MGACHMPLLQRLSSEVMTTAAMYVADILTHCLWVAAAISIAHKNVIMLLHEESSLRLDLTQNILIISLISKPYNSNLVFP